MQLVPVQTHEEIEMALVALRISWLQGELTMLYRQLAPLERALFAFDQQVSAAIGGLVSARDRLQQCCIELDTLTSRLHARLIADPEGHLDPIFSPPEMRHAGILCGIDVPEGFLDEESRTTTSSDSWRFADEWKNDTARRRHDDLSPVDLDGIRQLYRQLARAFHPDLATSASEHQLRLEVMFRINQAWHERDFVVLRDIAADAKDVLNGQSVGTNSYRLAWMKREQAQLESECHRLRQRIAQLRRSKTRPLWHNPHLAKAAISRRKARISQEVEGLELRHHQMVEEFRQALSTYLATRS